MRKLPLALALTAAIACFGAGARAASPPTPVPDMKPDLSAMSYFLGTWSCSSSVRGSHRPDTVTFSMDYDGRWIKSHDVAPVFDKFRTRLDQVSTRLTALEFEAGTTLHDVLTVHNVKEINRHR